MFVCHGAGPSKMLGCTNIVFILLNYKCNLLPHNFIIAMSIDTTQKTDFDFLYIFGCQCNNCVDVYSTAEFCCRQKYSLRWEMTLSVGKYGLFHSRQPWCNVWSIYKLSLYIHINIPQESLPWQNKADCLKHWSQITKRRGSTLVPCPM